MNKQEKTNFMNKSTFSEDEIKQYPYSDRKTYIANWSNELEPIKFYATDDNNAIEWLKRQYNTEHLIEVSERIVTYRKINIKL